MKQFLSKTMLAMILALMFSSGLIMAQTGQVVVGSNAGQQDSFHQAMQKALADQQARVNMYGQKATNQSNAPMSIDKVALANALIMMDVKKTLVSNFWDNPVTADPNFQALLIRILNQDTIQESDLAMLQNAADQVRAGFAQQAAAQQAAAQQAAAKQSSQSTSASTAPTNSSISSTPSSATTTQSASPPAITHPIVIPPVPQPGVIPAPALSK